MNHQALGSRVSIQPIYNTVMITGNNLGIHKRTRDAPPTIPSVLLLYVLCTVQLPGEAPLCRVASTDTPVITQRIRVHQGKLFC